MRSDVTPYEYGTGLKVTFSPPSSDGGDPITRYRVEYSTDDFNLYTREVQHLRVYADGGYYQLTYDTTTCTTCMVKANYVTGKLPWIATALEVKTALKNLKK